MDKETKVTQMPRVTARTTRAELLKAYNAALEKIEQLSSEEAPRESEQRVLEKALTYTDENVIKTIADLQVSISKALKDLTEKMIAESSRLGDLRAAVNLESARLQQLHEVEYNINTLTALIEAQAERKAAFEREMAEQRESFAAEMTVKREEWNKEQQENENSVRGRELQIKKQREREEEEYKYKLSLERRKEAAEYELRKTELQRELEEERKKVERELAERKAVLAAQENELLELRKRVERFPKELEEAVKKTEASVRTALQQQYEYDAKLAAKDVESEKRLSAMNIANLEAVVAKQQAQIAELAKQFQAATKQVQEMAVKAIESSSGGRVRATNGGDVASEQKRNV